MTKFFKMKGKPYFGVIFVQRKFFLKTLAKYNCSGPPPFRCQRYKVDWAGYQTQNYSITISMQKSFSQYAQLIKSFVRYTWFESTISIRPHSFFNHPIIIKVTLSFPKFVSAWKKISSFHQFILEIQLILQSQDLKGHAHFWPTQCKNYWSNF